MRSLLLTAIACCAMCGAARAAPVAVWRIHTEHLAEDRARITDCLKAEAKTCLTVVQDACLAALGADADLPAFQRSCDWRAIAAWEDDMNDTLAQLRTQLSGRNLANLNDSQRAWETSMLADVGLGMEAFEDGVLSGPVGAHIRARATAQRALYLRDMTDILGD